MSACEKPEERIVMSKELQQPQGLHNANNQADFLAEGLTGTFKTVLNNPVLPSGFDLVDPTSALKHKWEFANGNRVPIAEARRGLPSYSTGWER